MQTSMTTARPPKNNRQFGAALDLYIYIYALCSVLCGWDLGATNSETSVVVGKKPMATGNS